MWEIAENLHRAELTALERDEQVTEWIKLADEVSRQVDAKPKSGKKGGRPEAGTRKAAREIGVSEPDARRAVKVASLTPEAKEAAREGCGNGRPHDRGRPGPVRCYRPPIGVADALAPNASVNLPTESSGLSQDCADYRC